MPGATGALARLDGPRLTLNASVCALDGSTSINVRDEGPVTDPAELGIRVAEQLLSRGAARIIAQQRPSATPQLP